MRSISILVSTLALCAAFASGQEKGRNVSGGPLLPAQAAYDVRHYRLEVRVDPAKKSIEGRLTMRAVAAKALPLIVLDLDDALEVRRCSIDDATLKFRRGDGRIEISPKSAPAAGEEFSVLVEYGGVPREAKNPPWDGGFTWSKVPDTGEPWIATSCQGEGADLWWPCKDHPSDEPDEGADILVTVPEKLVCASNGKLESVTPPENGLHTFHWKVLNPINNYAIALNIAPYVEVSTRYRSVAGEEVPVSFWALPRDEDKARKLLPEILDHLRFFEANFGPYPFRNEKYGVAETPHLGMEHQTIIAYGYGFRRDPFDYDWLHHHEASHEWWGNLVTCPDWKDMWIHEGIGTYCQALYVEEKHGAEGYRKQMDKWRRSLVNAKEIAPLEVQDSHQIYFSPGGGNDIYYKGAWVIHALRGLIGKEALMKALRRTCYPDAEAENRLDGGQCHFCTTEDFQRTCEQAAGRDLGWFFAVYLRRAELPRLRQTRKGRTLSLRWEAPGGLEFPLPVEIGLGEKRLRLEMKGGKGEIEVPAGIEADIDPDHWLLRDLTPDRR